MIRRALATLRSLAGTGRPDDLERHIAEALAVANSRGEVGTGAGEGAPRQDTGSAWVTRSEDCPEAPAQAHLPAPNEPTPLADAALAFLRRSLAELEAVETFEDFLYVTGGDA